MKQRMHLAAGAILIVLGIAFAALPKEWIEETFGFEPDGGSGTLELLIALVPIVVGATLIVGVISRRRSRATAGRALPDES